MKLLIPDFGTRRWWVVSPIFQLLYLWWKHSKYP